MSIATLVIGLGGTGVLTLRALKRLYNTLPDGKNGAPNERVPTAFLAFDFDRSAQISGDHLGRFEPLLDEEFFYLNPQKLQERLRNIDRGQNGGLAWESLLRWFPDRAKIQIPTSEVEANGASQLRVLGRLGFFENDEVIERMLRAKLNQLGSEVDPSRLSEEKRVIIVSSIAGGTGAGMLIDMAYVARRQLLRPRVYAYVLLPEVFQDVDSGGRIYQNAYACIKELAYLKDQQIPFDADYERIAPIHLPIAGEEPFARIFLCSGDGFAGADSIKIATCQIAESILGQLQRTIQEKTLAIASNTLSADSQEEQKKRRTHCFSAVSSLTVDLRRVDLQETVFDKVVELLRNEKELQSLYLDDLREVLAKIGQEIAPESALTPPPSGPKEETADEEDASPPEVERILDKWNDLASAAADQTAHRITGEIDALLQDDDRLFLTESREELEERNRKLRELRELIFQQLTSEELTGEIPFLKESEAYRVFEKQIPRLLKLELLNPESQLTTDQALKRKALYSLLLSHVGRQLLYAPVTDSKDFQTIRESLTAQERELAGRRHHRFQSRRSETDLAEGIRIQRQLLHAAVHDSAFVANLRRVLLVRVRQEIERFLIDNREKVGQAFKVAQDVWTEGKYQTLETRKTLDNLGSLSSEVLEFLRKDLPKLLDESRRLAQTEGSAEERRIALSHLLKKRLDRERDLQGSHYILDADAETAENNIREKLVRSRQRIFEKRTPNPQRKGIALVMVPQGLIWPTGNAATLRRFLEASASQILAVRAQVEDYEGSRIWIYYEDLFNPPEHVRNIDEYYRTYAAQEYKELFHIDRRFLENPVFKEVNSKRTSIVVTCGNPGCRENISGLPRTERICPGCGKMIRSRCGNENCTENALDRHPEWRSKTCPVCDGFNYAAWWCCTKHGKVPVEVPIDKDRCPVCIEQHQKDPIDFPESRISVRPDLVDTRSCLHCEEIRKRNAKHEVFRIPKDLLPFYLNGVNGHDRYDFEMRIAPKYHLPDKHRCPHCRTVLIPVHHKGMTASCGGPVQ